LQRWLIEGYHVDYDRSIAQLNFYEMEWVAMVEHGQIGGALAFVASLCF
jgi:hypothetical protein